MTSRSRARLAAIFCERARPLGTRSRPLSAGAPGHTWGVTIFALPRFVPPEGGVAFRRGGVERSAVPKATVDEDSQAMRSEDEVGFYPKRLQLQPCNFPLEQSSSPPAGDAVRAEERDEAQLGGGIASRADGRHHRGALFARENRTLGTVV